MNLNKEELDDYDEIFNFIKNSHPDWEKLMVNGHVKIKTNQHDVKFFFITQLLEKFNLAIVDVSFSDYYGIVFGIKKLETS